MADRPMADTVNLRCWYCKVEPLDIVAIASHDGTLDRTLPTRWPPGDHDHALRPPSPGELLAAGAKVADQSLQRWTA